MSDQVIRIIGIDPGLRRTGWGVIEAHGSRLAALASGAVTTQANDPLAQRLMQLHGGLARVLAEWRPQEAAVEKTFVNRNAAATLKLGQARAMALFAPAAAGLSVAEYAPNLVKKSVVGAGHGDKRQIRAMIAILLPRANPGCNDAADALAIAITHAHHRVSTALRTLQTADIP